MNILSSKVVYIDAPCYMQISFNLIHFTNCTLHIEILTLYTITFNLITFVSLQTRSIVFIVLLRLYYHVDVFILCCVFG
jgi:hypothetical protein